MSEYFPEVAWTVRVTSSEYYNTISWSKPPTPSFYYIVTVEPVDYNDPGVETCAVGDYLIDFAGYVFEVTEIISATAPFQYKVYDVNERQLAENYGNAGPYVGRYGYIYRPKNNALILTQAQLRKLDGSAPDIIQPIEKGIIWGYRGIQLNGEVNDWYLPSIDELALIYSILHDAGIETYSVTAYWSSSEVSSTNAYTYSFSSGSSGNAAKTTSYRSIPVRNFVSSETKLVGDWGQYGYVIYVDGNNCIEAATNDLISDAKAWGASGRTLSTGSAVGTGLANTALIVLDLLDNSETDKAAQYCYELEAEVETDNVTKITLSSDFTTEYVGAGWQGGSEFRIGLGGGDFLSYLQNITSAARLWGGEITSNGNGTVHIAEGGGLRKLDEAGSEDIPITLNQGQGSKTEYVSWEEVAELELIDNAYNYIYYDYSDGVIATTTDFYSISFTQDFTIGRAYRYGTNVVVRLCGTNAWNFNRRVQLFGEEYFDVVRARGMIIGETGTRNISVTEGVLWAELVNRFPTEAFDSSGTDRFTYWYKSAVDTWTSVATQSQISNTQYNDLSTYTLKDLLPNRYGVHWIYMVHDSSVHVVYGNGNYTLAQAELAMPPSSLPGLLSSYATLIGKCIIEKNATVFTELLTPFTDTFTPSVVTYHDDLSGLVRIDVPDTTSYVHLDEYSATALFYDTANPPTTIPTNDIRRDSNIGIGKDPSYKLDVNGTGHFVEALTLDVPLTVANGGTGRNTSTTAYGLLAAGTTATGAHQTLPAGLTTQILVGGGASALPAWGTNIPTAVTIGSAYIYRAGGTDIPVSDGGTGQSTLTASKVLVGNGKSGILSPTNLHWDSSNNRLGILNTTPSYSLDVTGQVQLFNCLRIRTGLSSVDAYSTLRMGYVGDEGDNKASEIRSVQKGGSGSYTNRNIEFWTDSGATLTKMMTLDYSGRLGIGVDPSYKLDVNGTGRFTNDLRITRPSLPDTYLDIKITDVNTTFNAYDSDGYMKYNFQSNGTTILYIGGNTNRVGINNSSPSYSLDVTGTGRFTGALTLDSTLGFSTAGVTNIDRILDEDTMVSDSATALATQQSIKAYVDNAVVGYNWIVKTVVAATTGNITISTALNNGDTIDGVTLVTGDYVLVKDQTTLSQNGLYVVGASPARAPEMDAYGEFKNTTMLVSGGTVNAGSSWVCTTQVSNPYLGADDVKFAKISQSSSYTASTGITIVGNDIRINSPLSTYYGGTGLTGFTASGRLLYSTSSSVLTTLAAESTGNVLLSGSAPSWGKVGLTTHVSGALPVANGGTGLTAWTQGDVPYYTSGTALSKLSKSTTSNSFIKNSGTNNAPAWSTISIKDLSDVYDSMSPSTGEIMVYDGANSLRERWVNLPVGCDGKILFTRGSGEFPVWEDFSRRYSFNKITDSRTTTISIYQNTIYRIMLNNSGNTVNFNITPVYTILANRAWEATIILSSAAAHSDINFVVGSTAIPSNRWIPSELTSLTANTLYLIKIIRTPGGGINDIVIEYSYSTGTITSNYINVPSDVALDCTVGSTNTFDVESNIAWTSSESTSWFSISPTSGSAGTTTVTVTASEANTTSGWRTGELTISGTGISKIVNIRQIGGTSSFGPECTQALWDNCSVECAGGTVSADCIDCTDNNFQYLSPC